MKLTLFAIATAGSVLLLPLTAAADAPGMLELSIPAVHHGRDLKISLTYPSIGGTETTIGENPVFFGTSVRHNAQPKPGKYPVILLSPGWGGNYVRMSWLSAGLAAKGAIVVGVNHPNSTTGDIQYQSALNHWTRVQDLSTALDSVLKNPVLGPSIDLTHIYALGYSYGGWTALSMAGLKGERDGFEQYCKAAGDGSDFCRELKNNGVLISTLDRTKYEASYKDTRITAVAAIDPGLTWGMTAKDTSDLDVPVLLIGLGQGKDRLEATDTSATGSNFEAVFPAAHVEHIAPAMHFSALGICKPKGEAILIEEKDDPVCTDPAGTNRKVLLDKIIELLAKHFGLN
jgi:predicted dienelactone hydrolase